jgi:cell division protein FtsZ
MVHRIQNRNPGYSDFANMGSSASFNFSSTTTSNPITHGANALKLDNEIVQENNQEHINSTTTNEEIIHNNSLETESVVEDSSVNEMEKSFSQEAMESNHEQSVEENIQEDVSNDLKEFGVDSDAPDLFSSEIESTSSDDLLSSGDEEDDDLEIPAFLRRQKN